MFCKKGVLRNFAKFTGKHRKRLGQEFTGRDWDRCFPVNFAKFLRIPFLTEHLRWLLLQLDIVNSRYITENIENTIARLQRN